MSEAEFQPDLMSRRLVIRDSQVTPRVSDVRPVQYYEEQMQRVGVQALLEDYAGGMMPVEIAAARSWPIMVFTAWFEENAEAKDMGRAKALCAQSLAARGMNVLTMPRRDAADASLISALSRQATNAAAKLDPASWGGNDQPAFAGGGVTFNLNIDTSSDFKGRVVNHDDASVVEDKDQTVSFTITSPTPALGPSAYGFVEGPVEDE